MLHLTICHERAIGLNLCYFYYRSQRSQLYILDGNINYFLSICLCNSVLHSNNIFIHIVIKQCGSRM